MAQKGEGMKRIVEIKLGPESGVGESWDVEDMADFGMIQNCLTFCTVCECWHPFGGLGVKALQGRIQSIKNNPAMKAAYERDRGRGNGVLIGDNYGYARPREAPEPGYGYEKPW